MDPVAPPPFPHPQPDAPAPRLLVVDDESSTRAYLHEALTPHYSVEIVADAETALDSIRRGPLPDLILSDVVMPGVDGLGLLRVLRGDPATALLPVLLITGSDDETTRTSGFEAGADDYINKPIRARELLARVRTHLDLARLRRDEGDRLRHADADAALRASEQRFRALVNQATAGVTEVDATGRFTLVNRKFCELVGYTEAELLQLRFQDITHPDDVPRCQAIFDQALATGEPFINDKRHVRKDGGVIWINDSVSVVHDAPGTPPRAVYVAIDITERKCAEEFLRRSEEHFRLVVESTRDYVIFTIDPSGVVTSWNQSGVRLKGYQPEEVIGRHVSIFCRPEDVAEGVVERLMAEALARGRAEAQSWRVRKNGTQFWAEELLFPMRDEDDALLGFVKICRDLTERKAADDERARLLAAEQSARREAETANAAKDRLLAAVSHELRTPLAPVRMALFLLRREPQLSDAGREAVDMIRRNVEVEILLIDDLLDISRVVHGKLELNLGPVALHECVDRAVEVCREEMDAKGLTLTVELSAPADGVRGDATRLQQVFWNLLRNAVKFTPAGGRVAVRSRLDAIGERIVVEVSDTGIGIDATALPRLFNAFEQVAPAITRAYGGLGLGLSISHAIIESHGGRLSAASDGPERGTALTVELPLM